MGFFSNIKKIWQNKPKDRQDVAAKESELSAKSPAHKTQPTTEAAEEPWKTDLLFTLQQAEPKLSVWLDIILKGVEKADEKLWSRLQFLFDNLEIPEAEARDFIHRFQKWLKDMDYEFVSQFRSELQYRLALALELEDEEDERSRLFLKLSQGLNKTKEQISKRIDHLLQINPYFDEDFWEQLEEILITADIGFQPTMKLVDKLKHKVRENRIQDREEFKRLFQQELTTLFPNPPKRIKPIPPEVILLVGVNGVGKTTTIAKLAYRAQMQGRKPLIAAGDTFRAAAIEQLEIWAQRVGAGFYTKKAKADPAAVAYEALEKAQQEGFDLVFVDTAGRLHTKINLMDELKKIKRVLNKKHTGAPHRTILVVDATTGQNAVSQTKLFHEGIGVDEIILTKLDGTAKGGVILSIATELGLPITFVGLGEKMEDLRPFISEDFAKALIS